MIAERLRKAVLQAAIQGKLTQQLPQDGDARDLLGEITAEREQLIREGKIKRQKPLPEITEDEIPFEIPENWTWSRLGICLDVRDGTHDTPKYVSTGVPLLTSKNLSKGTLDFDNVKHISEEDAQLINERSQVDMSDILFAMIGSIGNPVLVKSTRDFCIKNVALFKPVNNTLEMRYVLYFLMLAQVDMKVNASGAVQSFVSLTYLRGYLVPLPPLSEQQRIVAKLEELLPQIDKLQVVEEELAKLQDEFPQKLRNSLLQAAIQGKLTEQMSEDRDARELLAEIEEEKKRLIKEGKIKKQKTLPEITEDEIPFEIPENWCWVRLGAVAALNPRNKIDDDKEVSFIPMASIQDGYGSNHGYEQRSWGNVKSGYTHFAENDIVVAKITPCFQNRKSAIVRGLANGYGAGTTELHVIRPLSERLSNRYLLHLFKTAHFIHNGCLVMTGTAGQQRVGRDYFENLLVPLPPYAEQQRIVAKLEELLPLCDALDVQ